MPSQNHPEFELPSPEDADSHNEHHEHQDTLLLGEVPNLPAGTPEAQESSAGSGERTPADNPPQFPTLDLTPLSQRYELLAEAGHGSMGNVYKARDRETGETVALKLLKPEIASDQSMMERFKKELLFARKITHKNVCRVHEFNRIGGIAFTSMEFVEGESLRSVLSRTGGLPQRKALDLALQLCSGLQEAHAQGIVHRDLKPENVMIDAQGNAKIMDFGIARSMDAMTRLTGSMVGTPAYMAPEQVAGKQVDFRTDIYSLGLIFYEIFTGRPAFQAENTVAVALKQMRESPRPPHELRPTIPLPIESAILKCLEKDPAMRFQSVAQLADALRAPASGASPVVQAPSPEVGAKSHSRPGTTFALPTPRATSPMSLQNPYKPSQPVIPGVPAPAPEKEEVPPPVAEPEVSRRARAIPSGLWIAAGALVVLIVGGWLWFRGPSSTSQSISSSQEAALDTTAPGNQKPRRQLPLAPGIVATTKELAKPWSSKSFLFRTDTSAEPIPALVVHLPNGQYWGISMIEPFGTCELEYVTDPRALQSEYGFSANHPMVGDPCTHTVYDLLHYQGGAPDGGLVRGAIVHGTGVRPPLAIEIEVHGKEISAVRME
jgi:serine/threonine protein kinase